MANICPFFKKDCEHYRPIYLLSILNKKIERAICNIIYPEIKRPIFNHQNGFMQWRSTESEVLVHGSMSTKLPVRSAVPQGSILSTLKNKR